MSQSKLREIEKAGSRAPAPTIADIPEKDLDKVLQEEGFPPASAGIARTGWTARTPLTKKGIRRLLEDAAAEDEAQQGK